MELINKLRGKFRRLFLQSEKTLILFKDLFLFFFILVGGGGRGEGGGMTALCVFYRNSHMRMTGMVLVSLRGCNHGFWSHLGIEIR